MAGFLQRHRAAVAEHKAAEAEHKAELEQARALADRLPDSNGMVSIEGLREFGQFTIDHDIDLGLLTEEWKALRVGLAQGGLFLKIESTLLLRKDEGALFEAQANLLKEVADREFRGGSRGVSVPLGHSGVRLRAGAFRGHMVNLGSHWETADGGVLTVTDQRVVYHGGRKTLEFPYSKLASMEVYRDAICLGVTSRQSTSMFGVSDPEFLVGLIHGAFNRRDEGVTIVELKGSDE